MHTLDALPVVLAPEEGAQDTRLTINRIVRETPAIWGHVSNKQARRALQDISDCRTPVMGGFRRRCSNCGHESHTYDSCRNRNCPSCLGHKSREWLAKRASELLPVGYFHVVFTVPEEIAKIALANIAVLCNILFAATNDTLMTIAADPDHLGVSLGFMAILHTWSQRLTFHPHIHCVVPGGGIALDGSSWLASKPTFFLPVRVLSRYYRRVFLERLQGAFAAGKLRFPKSIEHWATRESFEQLLSDLAKKEWVVYAKPPYGSPKQVLKYLARYTHRVAISNRRLVSFRNGQVTFRYRVSAETNQVGTMTLDAVEFLRRFSRHILPKGLKRIRYYGLLANSTRYSMLARCRELIAAAGCALPEVISSEPEAEIEERKCSKCGRGPVECVAIVFGRSYVRELRRRCAGGDTS